MESSCLFMILCLELFLQFTLITAQEPFDCYDCAGFRGKYTSTSDYSRNLKQLLSTIASDTRNGNGFYKYSVGKHPNKVNGIAVCRGDVSVSDCHSCLNDATQKIIWACPSEKEAIGYYFARCMLRYSDRPIFGIKELSPNCTVQNRAVKVPTSDAKKFSQKLAILFDGLRNDTASAGDSHVKFANGFENVTASLKVYGLMQCNPDLSHLDCSDCLQAGIRQLESCCSTVNGVGIYGPSCTIEFETYPFVNMLSRSSQPPTSPSGHTESKPGKGWESHKTWILIIVLFVLLMLLATFVWRFSLRRKGKLRKTVDNNVQITCVDFLQFDFSTIQVATNNFSNANRLGKCNPTTVYKGNLPNEREIAVKRLSNNAKYGELEFKNEVMLLADLQHRNLVKLLGFCIQKDSRLLIYEYLPNESLDLFLYDPVKSANLNWDTRHKIILGVARGLLYLHEDSQLRMIHGDLKPSNIVLDLEMNPKISNFSKASLVQADQTRGSSSALLGTYGYMPPEYVEQEEFSVKSDVFSFGVVILEIISGRMISSFWDGERGENLPNFAWRKWFEGKALEVVDQTLLPSSERHTTQVVRCINIALLCVQENPTSRPNMSSVVFLLNSNLVTLDQPSRPAFVICSDMDRSSSYPSSQKDKSYEKSVDSASIPNRA